MKTIKIIFILALICFFQACEQEKQAIHLKNESEMANKKRPDQFRNVKKQKVTVFFTNPKKVKGEWAKKIKKMGKELVNGNYKDVVPVWTSSVLEPKDKYSRFKLNDNDLNTCWAEGVDGDGIGEWIVYPASRRIEIILHNGLWYNKELFYKNNRIKKAEIVVYDMFSIDRNEIIGPYESAKQVVKFDDGMKPICIEFDSSKLSRSITDYVPSDKKEEVINNLPGGYIMLLRIKILSVYKGTKYNDTCISEIE